MNRDLVGNIHHEVQPVIGWMRLALSEGKSLTSSQMEAAVEKLYAALDNANLID